jgi:hypothetical protein
VDGLRELVLIDQEVRREGGAPVSPPTRRVAACAALGNPLAGTAGASDLQPLVELSVEVGRILTARALDALEPLAPRAYGKAALVGTDGDLEHGAAMIHVAIGLAMREGAGGGPALIPGNAKVGGAGTPIDVIFGGLEDAWDYDAMDTMTVSVPGTPRPGEILLIVAFLAGGRPNARVTGASPEKVAQVVAGLPGRGER